MNKKNKRIAVRIDDNTDKMIQVLKQAMEEKMHQDLTDSDVIRTCIHYFYKVSTGEE